MHLKPEWAQRAKNVHFDLVIQAQNIMTQHTFSLILILLLVCINQRSTFAQDLSTISMDGIKKEISLTFAHSIESGENLDIKGIKENIDDSEKSGFIDNGIYFETFADLMVGYESSIQGLEYQEINVITKNITVLSAQHALLTAHGTFSAKIKDGRILTGEFGWTFVYAKSNDAWKVIHSHMSNPRS